MGTGIVSVGLFYDGHHGLSEALLGIAAAIWLGLGLALIAGIVSDRGRIRVEARSPAALTGVAGTSVLGTRFVLQGWGWAGIALLVIATLLWLGLVGIVLSHWTVPTVGASFILTVSTESLALLAATLALYDHADWLLDVALVPFLLGLAFYLFVLTRFDLHQLAVGHGDHWVSGGALAISTLAAGKITLAAAGLERFGGDGQAFQDVTIALWILTMVWLPALVIEEFRHPRLTYDVRRWATVFPVGMYAACSFVVDQAADEPKIAQFARVWVWVGVAVWLIVFGAMLARGARLVGRSG
jgi:hypothetical protein